MEALPQLNNNNDQVECSRFKVVLQGIISFICDSPPVSYFNQNRCTLVSGEPIIYLPFEMDVNRIALFCDHIVNDTNGESNSKLKTSLLDIKNNGNNLISILKSSSTEEKDVESIVKESISKWQQNLSLFKKLFESKVNVENFLIVGKRYIQSTSGGGKLQMEVLLIVHQSISWVPLSFLKNHQNDIRKFFKQPTSPLCDSIKQRNDITLAIVDMLSIGTHSTAPELLDITPIQDASTEMDSHSQQQQQQQKEKVDKKETGKRKRNNRSNNNNKEKVERPKKQKMSKKERELRQTIEELKQSTMLSYSSPLAVSLDRSPENIHPLKLSLTRTDGLSFDSPIPQFKDADELFNWYCHFQLQTFLARAQSIIGQRLYRSQNKSITLHLGHVNVDSLAYHFLSQKPFKHNVTKRKHLFADGSLPGIFCTKVPYRNYHFIEDPAKGLSFPKLFDYKYKCRLEQRPTGAKFFYQYQSAIFRHNTLTNEVVVDLTMRVVSVIDNPDDTFSFNLTS